MDAIVLAGGIPTPQDPLYPYTQGRPKALLDIAGKPMTQWVVEALEGSAHIRRILIVGLKPTGALHGHKIAGYLPDQGGIIPNILAGLREVLRRDPQAEYTVVASGDIPAITAVMVDWVIEHAADGTPFDIAYSAIRREVMEARFPEARRTFTRLKDLEVCGGDLQVVRTALVNTHTAIWERLIAARKNPFKQAAIIGWDVLLKLALRRLALEEALTVISRRLGVRGKLLLPPYAELGMDADKPHQVDLLRRELANGNRPLVPPQEPPQ